VYVDIPDDPKLVDDEDRPLGSAVREKDTVRLCDLSVRIEIAKKRIGDAPKAFGPCMEAVSAVYA